MAEMGHTDPALALSIYAHAMRRDEGENERLRYLVNGEAGQEREAHVLADRSASFIHAAASVPSIFES
jgi:hypothetical protein